MASGKNTPSKTSSSTSQPQGIQLSISDFLPNTPIYIKEPIHLLRLLMEDGPLTVLQRRLYWLVLKNLKNQQIFDPDKSIPIPDKDVQFSFHYREIYDGHSNKHLRQSVDEIQSAKVKASNGKGAFLSVTVFPVARYEPFKGLITVEVHRYVMPLLLQISGGYSSFDLKQALKLSSEYAQTLFSYLSRYKKDQYWEIALEDFRQIMGATNDSYSRYTNLKGRVIDIALQQINKFTELQITCEPIKRGKAIVSLRFHIQTTQTILMEEIKETVANAMAMTLPERSSLALRYLEDYQWDFTASQKNEILQRVEKLDAFLRAVIYVENDPNIVDPTKYVARSVFHQAKNDKG